MSIWRSYLQSGVRNLRRHGGYTIINVIGLAVGMACFMLIGLWARYEYSADAFHPKADRIYRIVTDMVTPSGTRPLGVSSPPWGPMLKAELPEVESYARFGMAHALVSRGDQHFREEHALWADSTTFDVFAFEFIRGDASTALNAPFSVVLSEETARKYFGKEDPIGQTLMYEGRYPLTVRGVVGRFPGASHILFDMLISLRTKQILEPDAIENWHNFNWHVYVAVRPGTDPAAFSRKIEAFALRHYGQQPKDNGVRFFAEPLRDVYFDTYRIGSLGPYANRALMSAFSVLSVFVLVIACVNFMNLATARSTERAREIGVRKALGAHRSQIAVQFILETVVLALLAGVAAGLSVVLLLPFFNELVQGHISISGEGFFPFGATLVGLSVTVGVIAGAYPSFVMSSFHPAQVLKKVGGGAGRRSWLRNSLVVFQFAMTFILIVLTLVVQRQINYLRTIDMGFNKERELAVDFRGDTTVVSRLDALRQAFRAHPQVKSVVAGSAYPGGSFGVYSTKVEVAGSLKEINMPMFAIDFDYMNHLGLKLVAGRSFDRRLASDSTGALILNETAVRALGFTGPEEAIGKRFEQVFGYKGEVIGVVRDFYYQPLHNPLQPLSMRIHGRDVTALLLKLDTGETRQTVAELERIWKGIVPERPFEARMLDDVFHEHYQIERRYGEILAVNATLAILIACMGLLGLATFTAERRTKEVGIRKVMGASVGSIIFLLTRDFSRLVLIAIIVAAPVAYLAGTGLLSQSANHATLSVDTFIIAGLLALLIATLTVSYHAIRVATSNPTNSLRYE